MFGLGIVLGGWGRGQSEEWTGVWAMQIGNWGDLSGNLRGIEVENRSSIHDLYFGVNW